jgi:tetratricopeptide (TPR) repeat protein
MTTITGYPRLSAAERELREGRFDAASALAIQHLRQHRNEPRGLALIATIALKTGALVQAEQFFRRAIAAGARSLEVQRDLAAAINQQERLGDALRAFTALQQKVADPQIRSVRALILDKLGRHADALKVHEELVAMFPDEPQYLIGYGLALRSAGKTDEAIAAYRHVTSLDPERGEAWWSLANIKTKVLTDHDIDEMNDALGVAVDTLNIVPIHFALGRAWHDRGEYENAFRHFSEANQLRAETINYDPRELTEEVDDVIRRFGRDFYSLTSELDAAGPVPIFLISMPRSGSTLLEQMLDRHPQIEAVGELPYVRALSRSALEIHTRRSAVKITDIVQNMDPAEARAFGQDYLHRASLHWRNPTRYFIDKMPMNWSDVPFIRRILPHAKFIEIRRPAMDCCFSNYMHYFSRAHASSFSLDHIGRAYVDYARMMDHIGSLAPETLYRVRYEELIERPEEVLRGVLGHLGLEWDEALLSFHESGRVVRTPSAEQVRRPLNREGMGTWEPYAQWLEPLREALGPLADQ